MVLTFCAWLYRRAWHIMIKMNVLYVLTAIAMCLITYRNYKRSYVYHAKIPHQDKIAGIERVMGTNIPVIAREDFVQISDGQDTIDYLAEYLEVKVKVLYNRASHARVEITFRNTGLSIIKGVGWNVYFNQLYGLVTSENSKTDSVAVHDAGFIVSHVKGTLFSIQPNPAHYKVIRPDETRTLSIEFAGPLFTKTDIFPNWYVTSGKLIPKVLESTKSESMNFVEDFQFREQWQRDDNDQYNPFSAKQRFQMNEKNTQDLGSVGSDVIPTLYEAKINKEDPEILINIEEWRIVFSHTFESEAKYLSEKTSIMLSPNQPLEQFIHITVLATKTSFIAEEYILQFRKDDQVVRLIANDKAGAFYGVQTLLSILKPVGMNKYLIPSRIDIRDKPRFPYRGVQLDVARNFIPKEAVMRLIDVMSTYKLNKLHLHLSDDEGWRLEIPGLEDLTKFGSNRCHDLLETDCLLPQHGSGPSNDTFGSGFYTTNDYRDILKYASDRHVQIIPEIDIPGHSRAAIKSMLQRKRVSREKDRGDDLLLHEKGDNSDYNSPHMFNDGTINICLESTYKFLKIVISEIKILHEEIQPLQMIHIGGDEVAKGSWEKSSECKRIRSRHSIPDLKLYLLNRIFEILSEDKTDAGVWEDGVIPSFEKVTPYHRSKLGSKSNYSGNIYAYAWDNIWESGKAPRAYTLANSGYKVVMSQATHLYLDHPHEPDPEERGLSWATRYTDTQKVFSFLPTDLYGNADTDYMGNPLQQEANLCSGKDQCNVVNKNNIVGMEAHLWTETIRFPDQLFHMAFPRLLAVAERSWHKAIWEGLRDQKMQGISQLNDWTKFSNTLGYKELKRLDNMGVPYRIPPPGAILNNRILEVNVQFPGLSVEYSKDGGRRWTEAKRFVGPGGTKLWGAKVFTNNDIHVRTMSADKSRHSRVVTVPSKEEKAAE